MEAIELKVQNFINGQFVATAQYIDSFDPSTGEVWAKIPDSDAGHVDTTVQAAAAAFPGWASTPAQQRSKIMLKIADILETRLEDFAQMESRDQGKPVWLAKSVDMPKAVNNFRFFATNQLHALNRSNIMDGANAVNYTVKRPVGVAGLISPWNFPLYLLTFKIAPALAAGNTVVAKPSEMTSVTAWKLCEIFNEAEQAADQLLEKCVGADCHKKKYCMLKSLSIKKARLNNFKQDNAMRTLMTLWFTSTSLSSEVYLAYMDANSCLANRSLTLHVNNLLLERSEDKQKPSTHSAVATGLPPGVVNMVFGVGPKLGGKNPGVIFNDADLEKCLQTTIRSSFLNQGQVCLCTSRLFVQRGIYVQFLEKFVDAAKKLVVGDPKDEQSFNGSLISKEHLQRVKDYVSIAEKEGASVLCGKEKLNLPERNKQGYFMRPTVITGVADTSRLMTEEIFGPVVCVVSFDTEDEVVRRANSVKYGLAATVWSSNVSTLHSVAQKLEAGTVWANCWLLRDLNMPFGGMKESGLGRESGKDSLEFFTEEKTICVKL